jgi:glutamate-5-semialdehyde dehydrogenase
MKAIEETILDIAKSARLASKKLALTSSEDKENALLLMSESIRKNEKNIIDANQKDLLLAAQKKLSAAFIDRLVLNKQRTEAMAETLKTIAAFKDPVGTIMKEIKRPNQLIIQQVRAPIGVIAVIYESRPNVSVDAASLCLKSGNAVILRGGSESFHSSMAIMMAMQEGLKKTNLPCDIIQMVPTVDRCAIDSLLTLEKYIDVIVPRGGPTLLSSIIEKTRIPLFKHLAGLCHTYLHADAEREMARKIVLNAKMRRTGICGATEILLVDEAIVTSHMPTIVDDLINAGCEVRGDEQIARLDGRVKLTTKEDYHTEFLDAIIAIKVVKDLSGAITHIEEHGTHHTDAIVTNNQAAAERFMKEVDSAIVMHNTSTQFADGHEFGMGAEIGIATGKLHARGPVGALQLTTFKYLVKGKGQVRT